MSLQEELEQQGLWLFKYRSVLPIFILFVGTFFYLRTELYPETFFIQETPFESYYDYFCLLIGIFGLLIRIYTVGHTPKNTSGRNVAKQVAESLNTTGIYSIVRHPLYLGNFFMWLAPALMTGNIWFILFFCLSYWIYYERIMFAEEQYLKGKFGDDYTNWAKQTPAFLPRFRNFTKPNLSFSWRKVLKKEKNGLVALLIIFSAFDIAGKYIECTTDYNYYLLFACLLSILYYLFIKFFGRKMKLFVETGR